jgi:hypothetical protein
MHGHVKTFASAKTKLQRLLERVKTTETPLSLTKKNAMASQPVTETSFGIDSAIDAWDICAQLPRVPLSAQLLHYSKAVKGGGNLFTQSSIMIDSVVDGEGVSFIDITALELSLFEELCRSFVFYR